MRPRVKYSHELFTEICDRRASGETFSAICRSDESRYPTRRSITIWAKIDEVNAAMYQDAEVAFEESLFDSALDIARTPQEGIETVQRGENTETRTGDMLGHRKLQVDTIFKMLAIKNEKYRSNVNVNHGGQSGNPIGMLIAQVNGTAILPVPDEEPDGE